MHAWEHLCSSKRVCANAQVWPHAFACVERDLCLCEYHRVGGGRLFVCSHRCMCLHACVSTYVRTVHVCILVAMAVAKGEPLYVCRPSHPKP